MKKQKLKVENRRLKYDVSKLQQPEIRKAFSVELKNRFQVLKELENVEDIWDVMGKGYTEASKAMLRMKKKDKNHG